MSDIRAKLAERGITVGEYAMGLNRLVIEQMMSLGIPGAFSAVSYFDENGDGNTACLAGAGHSADDREIRQMILTAADSVLSYADKGMPAPVKGKQ